MIQLAVCLLLSLSSYVARAEGSRAGVFFLDPHLAMGFNPAQGTHSLVGLDLGYTFTENLAGGLHTYYSFGQTPEHDRDMGLGPFVTYVQPLMSVLTAHARQEVNYVNQRERLTIYSNGQKSYSHIEDTGSASVTSIGLHLQINPNFGVAIGYRLVFSLTNDDIGRKRSGTFVGLTIGL